MNDPKDTPESTPRPQQPPGHLSRALKRWVPPLLALTIGVVIATVLWGKLRDEVWAYFSDGKGTRVEVQDDKARMVLWQDPKPSFFQDADDATAQAAPANLAGGRMEAAFSADGTMMILVRRDKEQANADLYQSNWDGRVWSRPLPIQSVNTSANETSPWLSKDGNYLFFASDREGGQGGYDIHVARWDGSQWTAAEALGDAVNTAADETGPSLSPDGSQLFFTSKRAASGVDDIFVAKRIFPAPEPEPAPEPDEAKPQPGKPAKPATSAPPKLPDVPLFAPAAPATELNSTANDLRAALTERGNQVFLASDRDRNENTGFGVYLSRVVDGRTLPPERVDFYIDRGDVTDPAVRMDGFDLLFSADADAVAALEGAQEPAEGYRLFQTTTREVFGYTSLERWDQFKLLMERIGWRLLVALAALIALLYLLEKWQDITSLFHKCLAGSAAVHLLILLLMMIWQVTQTFEQGGEPAASIAISIDALAQEELALESTPEVAEMTDTNLAVVAQKLENDFVLPDFKPVQPTDSPPIVTSTAKESLVSDVRPSKANSALTMEPVPLPTEQQELTSSLPESLLPEPDLPELPELAAADEARDFDPADPSKDIFRPSASIPQVAREQARMVESAETPVQKSTSVAEIQKGSASPETSDTGGDQVVAHAGLEAKGSPPEIDGSGTQVVTMLPITGPNADSDPLLPGKLETPKEEIDTADIVKKMKESRGKLSPEMIKALGGSDASEKAIGSALEWLVRNQESDGHWSTRKHGANADYDTAGTGLALLCFYGWGLNHSDGGKYQPAISRGINWLVAQQRENGDLSGNTTSNGNMYCHGIATIALCEAYGMTKDPKLKGPAEKAIARIIASQSPSKGGWRYKPVNDAGVPSPDSDTSVTGWQYMALHSARLAGLVVPESAFQLARKWFDYAASGKHKGLYGYDGPGKTNAAMTATGMFCRQLDLVPPHDPMMQESAEYLKMRPMNVKTPEYYHVYYATLALYQHQGPVWLAWNEKLQESLPMVQRKDGAEAGSYDPHGNFITSGGRVISTTMATLSLQVYYRILPMYGFRNEDAPPAAPKPGP